MAATSSLSDEEATQTRLLDRPSATEARRAAMVELPASTNAEAMRNRLAAAGCGAPLKLDAAAILDCLRGKAA